MELKYHEYNKKIDNIILISGLLISSAFGMWHFIIPYQYHWNLYFLFVRREITVSVDWINFFFSLFLTGNSLLLLIYRKKILTKEVVSFTFYGFLTFVWLTRIIITIVHPWNLNKMLIVQIVSFILIFMILLIPFVRILLLNPKNNIS
jgi:hypothetical protein